jgi:hypothetical protein
MYPWLLSLTDGFPANVYVLLNRSGQASYDGLSYLSGHHLDGLGVSG